MAALALLAAGSVAAAGPAAALDHGPLVPGTIYLLNEKVTLEAATDANVITSGVGATRQWQALTVDGTCPAGTTNTQAFVRIPMPGQPNPDFWDEVGLTAYSVDVDGEGRPYSFGNNAGFALANVIMYLNAHGNTDPNFKLILVCLDDDAMSMGYFQTDVTVSNTGLTDGTDVAWSYNTPPPSIGGGGGGQAAATTTTLDATPSGADVALTATVSPSSAAGTVTFSEGDTTLGTAPVSGGTASLTVPAPSIGLHTYVAGFTPTDAAAFQASASTELQVTVGATQDGTITITLGVPAAPSGMLTLSVPDGATVPLDGARDSANTKVTATGTLPQITVNDTRNDATLSQWEVNVQASDFTGSAGTIAAKYLGWTPGTPSITPDPGSPLQVQAGTEVPSFLENPASLGLGSSQTLARTTTNGRGSTAIGGQLSLAIPGSALQGSYTSTLTVTLVSG